MFLFIINIDKERACHIFINNIFCLHIISIKFELFLILQSYKHLLLETSNNFNRFLHKKTLKTKKFVLKLKKGKIHSKHSKFAFYSNNCFCTSNSFKEYIIYWISHHKSFIKAAKQNQIEFCFSFIISV